jgi:predicted glycoside hydrolase/deacetylase ChbG (UPF0249 family)
MRFLIVNGDDFGHARGVTDGIVQAHLRGILTSTSLMVTEPDAERAGRMAREHPNLSVGIHFVEDGTADLDDPAQLDRAIRSQLDRFRELVGRPPTHIDSHHHAHREGDRAAEFARVAAELDVPLRFDGTVSYIGGFWPEWEPGITNLDYIRRPFLLHLIDSEVGQGYTELACHPGQVTEDLDSSYREEREIELATLTEPGLREEVEARGVRLVSYHDLRGRRGARPGAGSPGA